MFVLFIIVFLFIYYTETGVGTHQCQGKREVNKRKGIEAQMVYHPTQSRAIDAIIRDEEQNGRQKREKRKKQRIPNPVVRDHLVPQGPYSEPLLITIEIQKFS